MLRVLSPRHPRLWSDGARRGDKVVVVVVVCGWRGEDTVHRLHFTPLQGVQHACKRKQVSV